MLRSTGGAGTSRWRAERAEPVRTFEEASFPGVPMASRTEFKDLACHGALLSNKLMRALFSTVLNRGQPRASI